MLAGFLSAGLVLSAFANDDPCLDGDFKFDLIFKLRTEPDEELSSTSAASLSAKPFLSLVLVFFKLCLFVLLQISSSW